MQQTGKKHFFNRRPKLTATMFGLLISIFLLLIAETTLKKKGFKRGIARQTDLWEVDSVILRTDYATDTNGIMAVSAYMQNNLQQHIAKRNPITSSDTLDLTVLQACNDFIALNNPLVTDKSVFGRYISGVKQKTNPDALDSAILRYITEPVNSSGFRSIEFKNYNTDKPKVLLLGDSYTWGRSAQPITNSFADMLLANNLCMFNTGMVGADPAQYEAIARLWIPALKPHVVCVNYYLGNDNLFYPRQPLANQPPWYVTNAGWLNAFPAGFYVAPQDAWQFAKDAMVIPANNSPLNRFCAKTRIGTQLWFLLAKAGLINPHSARVKQLLSQHPQIKKQRYSVSIQYLRRIKELCEANNAKFILSVIPKYNELNYNKEQLKKLLFLEIPFFIPENLTLTDYVATPTDGHFNNSGHQKYANHLLRLIHQTQR